MYSKRQLSQRLALVIACVLIVVGLFGAIHAYCAAVSQSIYLRTKYGYFRGTRIERPQITDPLQVAQNLERASSLYSKNYYFPVYAASTVLSTLIPTPSRIYTSGKDLIAARNAADLFARQAIALNPYNAEARYCFAYSLVAKGKHKEAIQYWEKVLETDYWTRDFQNFYAELLLREGSRESIEKALTTLPFAQGPLRTKLLRYQRILRKSKNASSPRS